METNDTETLSALRRFMPHELIPAMLDVRAEMLDAGEPADEVVEILGRMCTLLGVDPADLRRAQH